MGLGELLALNIIVESRVSVAIEIQIFECVVSGEVLEKHKKGPLQLARRITSIVGYVYIPRIERVISGNG